MAMWLRTLLRRCGLEDDVRSDPLRRALEHTPTVSLASALGDVLLSPAVAADPAYHALLLDPHYTNTARDAQRIIFLWTGESQLYREIGRLLRQPTAVWNTPVWTGQIQPFLKFIKLLLAALADEAPAHPSGQALFRLEAGNTTARYPEGAIVHEDRFISTSHDRKHALSTNLNQFIVGDAYTAVEFRKTLAGRRIESFSAFPNEHEVLLPPGARYRVLSVQRIDVPRCPCGARGLVCSGCGNLRTLVQHYVVLEEVTPGVDVDFGAAIGAKTPIEIAPPRPFEAPPPPEPNLPPPPNPADPRYSVSRAAPAAKPPQPLEPEYRVINKERTVKKHAGLPGAEGKAVIVQEVNTGVTGKGTGSKTETATIRAVSNAGGPARAGLSKLNAQRLQDWQASHELYQQECQACSDLLAADQQQHQQTVQDIAAASEAQHAETVKTLQEQHLASEAERQAAQKRAVKAQRLKDVGSNALKGAGVGAVVGAGFGVYEVFTDDRLKNKDATEKVLHVGKKGCLGGVGGLVCSGVGALAQEGMQTVAATSGAGVAVALAVEGLSSEEGLTKERAKKTTVSAVVGTCGSFAASAGASTFALWAGAATTPLWLSVGAGVAGSMGALAVAKKVGLVD